MQVDTVNVWYSPNINKWSVCALIKLPNGDLRRDKNTFQTFSEAIQYVTLHYEGDK